MSVTINLYVIESRPELEMVKHKTFLHIWKQDCFFGTLLDYLLLIKKKKFLIKKKYY